MPKFLNINYLFILLLSVFNAGAATTNSNPLARNTFFSVKEFGAKGDGKAIDSYSINKAIDAAIANGGGTIYFPAGNYLSYSIRLKSNISLYIDQGATIIAAEPTDKEGYDAPEPNLWGDSLKYQDYGHSHWHNSLIGVEHIENISILGPGLIWGKGLTRSTKSAKNGGNKSISLRWCHNVIIRDVSILHGGWFGILATGVDNLTIDNVKMDTNRDGMDIDCCVNVRISNCSINSPFDDGICLKSSYGLGIPRATENVTITNCQVSGYDEGTFLDGTYKRNEVKAYHNGPTGRIKMGTESNGGFKNVTISNCVFDYCRGLALETVDGALLEDVTITNITMRDIVNAPIFIRLGARMRGPENTPVGELRRVIISNIMVHNADSAHGCIVSGIPGHPIRDIKFDNIRIYYKGGGNKELDNREVPEFEKDYPEPYRFGTMPEYGFFIRHVEDIELNNIEVSYINKEARTPFILDDVKGATLRFVKAQKEANTPYLRLKNTDNLFLFHSFGIDTKKIDHSDKDHL